MRTKKKPLDFARRQLLMTLREQRESAVRKGSINGEKMKAGSNLAIKCQEMRYYK